MDITALIDKYYADNPPLKHILCVHSRDVADRCLEIAGRHPELHLDLAFLEEAALLHDIGIIHTDAPGIHCFGSHPYICHGYLGAEMLRSEGLYRHARVCERHTGAGLSAQDIINQNVPVPVQDYLPETLEEQLICFADKFYSKTHLDCEKSVEKARKSLEKYGEAGVRRFDHWCKMFL